jgi:hypothetical protein
MRDPGFVLQVEHLLVQEVRRRSMGQEGRFDLLDPSLPLERSNEDGIGASDYIDYYDMSFATALFFLRRSRGVFFPPCALYIEDVSFR